MKKSFTLLEVIISITIFMILLVFLYKVLDQTKSSNKQFNTKNEKLVYTNNIYNIFLEDIAESYSKITILKEENNSIVQFKSNNTYHNSFFNNITYLISSSDKLIRIESKSIFEKANTPIDFYDNAYIDILFDNIEYFEVVKNTHNNNYYAIALKQKDKTKVVFNTYKFHPEVKKNEEKNKKEIK